MLSEDPRPVKRCSGPGPPARFTESFVGAENGIGTRTGPALDEPADGVRGLVQIAKI